MVLREVCPVRLLGVGFRCAVMLIAGRQVHTSRMFDPSWPQCARLWSKAAWGTGASSSTFAGVSDPNSPTSSSFFPMFHSISPPIALLFYPQRSLLIASEWPLRCRSPNYQPAAVLGPQYRRHQGGGHVHRKAIPPRAAHRRRLLTRGQCAHALRSPGRLEQPTCCGLRFRLRESVDLVPVSLDSTLSCLVCLRAGCNRLAVGPRRVQ